MSDRSLNNTLPREALLEAEMDGSYPSPVEEIIEAAQVFYDIACGVRRIQEESAEIEVKLNAFMCLHTLDGLDEYGLDSMTSRHMAVKRGFILSRDLESPSLETLKWYSGLRKSETDLSRIFDNLTHHPAFLLVSDRENLFGDSTEEFFLREEIAARSVDIVERAFSMYDLEVEIQCNIDFREMGRYSLSLLDRVTGLVIRKMIVDRNGMVLNDEKDLFAMKVVFCNATLNSGRLIDIEPLAHLLVPDSDVWSEQ
jgi:hypothetical protein